MQPDVQMSTSVTHGTVPGSTCCEHQLGTPGRATAELTTRAVRAAEHPQHQGCQGDQGAGKKHGSRQCTSAGMLCSEGHRGKFCEWCGNWYCDAHHAVNNTWTLGGHKCHGADDERSLDGVDEWSTVFEVPRYGGHIAVGPLAAPTPSVTTTQTRGLVPDCNLKSYIGNLVGSYIPHPYVTAEDIEMTCQRIMEMREATQPFQMHFAHPLPGAVTNAVVGHLSTEWREDEQVWDVIFIAVDNVDVCTRFFSPDQVVEQLRKRALALRHPATNAASLAQKASKPGGQKCQGAEDEGSLDGVDECTTMFEVPRYGGHTALGPFAAPSPDQVAVQSMQRAQALRHPAAKAASLTQKELPRF